MTRTSIVLALVFALGAHRPASGAGSEGGVVVRATLAYAFTPSGPVDRLSVKAAVPTDVLGRQDVLSTEYEPRPRQTRDAGGMRYAWFSFASPLDHPVEVRVVSDVRLYPGGLSWVRAHPGARRIARPEDLARDLDEEMWIEACDPAIEEAAKGLEGKDPAATARRVLDFVTDHLASGGYDSRPHGALWALVARRGDCTEFTNLYVALCRAAHLPARVWTCHVALPVGPGDTSEHDLAEVYLGDLGWVPVDPYFVKRHHATFSSLPPVYVLLQNVRNDVHFTHLGSNLMSFEWVGDGKVTFTQSFSYAPR